MLMVTLCVFSSSDIQSALLINAMDRAVAQFGILSDMAQCILSSKCQHLVTYVCKTASFWYKILQDKLCRWQYNCSHIDMLLVVYDMW